MPTVLLGAQVPPGLLGIEREAGAQLESRGPPPRKGRAPDFTPPLMEPFREAEVRADATPGTALFQRGRTGTQISTSCLCSGSFSGSLR